MSKVVNPNDELGKAAAAVNAETAAAKGEKVNRPWKARKVAAMSRALATLKSLVYVPVVGAEAKVAGGVVEKILGALNAFPADFVPPKHADASGFSIGEEVVIKSDCEKYTWLGLPPGSIGKVLAMQAGQLFVAFNTGKQAPVFASACLPVKELREVAQAEPYGEETEETDEGEGSEE